MASNTVLVLNASYELLNVATLQRAIKLIFKGKAEVLETVAERSMNSQRERIGLPSIIRMLYFIPRPRKEVPMNKRNLMVRDQDTCQYCGRFGDTVDHVMPKSRGGLSTWDNCVCACGPCNTRKGSRTPDEAGMPLKRKPKRPGFLAWMLLKRGSEGEGWRRYLSWYQGTDDLGAPL